MKIVAHCAVWVLAFCAVLVSPVILIFGVPLMIGVGADVVQAGAAPLAAVFTAGSVAFFSLSKAPVRASFKAMLGSAVPLGRKPLASPAVARHAAKSISWRTGAADFSAAKPSLISASLIRPEIR